MSAVQSYSKLRKDLAARDRSLREKVVSLEEAASFVRDGDSVGIGGSTMSRTPMGLIWARHPRKAQEALLLAQHRVQRRRPSVRLGRLRPHDHQLVQSGHPVGHLEGDASLRGDRKGALRRVEPHGDRHAISRRRHGRAVHADPLDAGIGRPAPASRRGGDGLPFHQGEAAARPRAQSGRGSDPRAALRCLRQCPDRRATSSWTSTSPWPPTR